MNSAQKTPALQGKDLLPTEKKNLHDRDGAPTQENTRSAIQPVTSSLQANTHNSTGGIYIIQYKAISCTHEVDPEKNQVFS
jgi:hypothetical protein